MISQTVVGDEEHVTKDLHSLNVSRPCYRSRLDPHLLFTLKFKDSTQWKDLNGDVAGVIVASTNHAVLRYVLVEWTMFLHQVRLQRNLKTMHGSFSATHGDLPGPVCS